MGSLASSVESHVKPMKGSAPHAGQATKMQNRCSANKVKLEPVFNFLPQCPDTAAFLRNLEALPKDERHACLMVTGPEVTATLAQLVSCVGCRRAVENLYQVPSRERIKEGKDRRATDEREESEIITTFASVERKRKNLREEEGKERKGGGGGEERRDLEKKERGEE